MGAVNLAVDICGITMKNPVMDASGTFGSGKEMAEFYNLSLLGAITTKGTSLEPWEGNPYPRTAETPAGMLNSIGLENDGVKDLIEIKLPFLRQFDVPVIVNIVGRTPDEYAEVARRLDGVPGVAGLEVNISCPNVKEGLKAFGTSPEASSEVVRKVRAATRLPLITKLSPNVTDVVVIAKAVVEAGSDALSLINTLLGAAIDIKTRKWKLAKRCGGLSGRGIHPVAVWMVRRVYEANLGVPIIGMGGVSDADSAIELILAGANAVAIGTETFRNPLAIVEVIDGIKDYLTHQGNADVSEIIGTAE